MKKYLLTLVAIICVVSAYSQITLEKTFSHDDAGSIRTLTNNGRKIDFVDFTNNKIFLYNMNYTLWKTINIPVYAGYKPSMLTLVTDNLFDTNPLVEYAIVYDNTSLTGSKAEIINENGVVLLSVPNGNFVSAMHFGGNVYKLAVSLTSGDELYYSVPGYLSCDQCGLLGGTGKSGLTGQNILGSVNTPIPNPSAVQTEIVYQLPAGVHSGNIIVYNTEGREIKKYAVTDSEHSLKLDNSGLSTGVYFYRLQTENGISEGRKMFIVK